MNPLDQKWKRWHAETLLSLKLGRSLNTDPTAKLSSVSIQFFILSFIDVLSILYATDEAVVLKPSTVSLRIALEYKSSSQ